MSDTAPWGGVIMKKGGQSLPRAISSAISLKLSCYFHVNFDLRTVPKATAFIDFLHHRNHDLD